MAARAPCPSADWVRLAAHRGGVQHVCAAGFLPLIGLLIG